MNQKTYPRDAIRLAVLRGETLEWIALNILHVTTRERARQVVERLGLKGIRQQARRPLTRHHSIRSCGLHLCPRCHTYGRRELDFSPGSSICKRCRALYQARQEAAR